MRCVIVVAGVDGCVFALEVEVRKEVGERMCGPVEAAGQKRGNGASQPELRWLHFF